MEGTTRPLIAKAGRTEKILVATCTSSNGKPPSTVTWDTKLKGEAEFQEIRNSNGTITVISRYRLVPSREAHRQQLMCVVNYQLERFTDSMTLNVQCKRAGAGLGSRDPASVHGLGDKTWPKRGLLKEWCWSGGGVGVGAAFLFWRVQMEVIPWNNDVFPFSYLLSLAASTISLCPYLFLSACPLFSSCLLPFPLLSRPAFLFFCPLQTSQKSLSRGSMATGFSIGRT